MTIRGSINKLLTDSAEVQNVLIAFLFENCKPSTLIMKEIIETYFYIFDELERVYAHSTLIEQSILYYRILISLKDYVNDPDLPKT